MKNVAAFLQDTRGFALVAITLAALAGMLFAASAQLSTTAFLAGTGLALFCLIVCWRYRQARLPALLACCFLFGAWRYASVSPLGDPTAISAFIGSKKLEVQGSITEEPKLQERSRLLMVSVSSISLDQGTHWQNARGNIEVIIPGSVFDDPYAPNYGDVIELQGLLSPPPPHSPPAMFASMTFPRLSVRQAGGIPLIAALYRLRFSLALILEQTLQQSFAATLIALLLSLRTPALKPLISAFNATGTAHLIAPSGFKVTIVAGLVTRSTRWLHEKRPPQFSRLLPAERKRGEWRRWLVTSLQIACIIFYTFLSGAGPAALRAGIMGVLLVLAPRFGRNYHVYNALAGAALLMSLFDPFVLWDVGFQLSVVGTLGIVMLTPYFERLLRPVERLPLGTGSVIVENIAVTLAAEIATLPIFMLNFQQVPLIAPIANVLSVPLLATLLILGLLICFVGLVSLTAAMLFAWVAYPLLWYLTSTIPKLANLPGACLTVPSPDMRLSWGYYGLLALVIGFMMQRWPLQQESHLLRNQAPLSHRQWLALRVGAALVIILATGSVAASARASGDTLTISFLDVGSPVQIPQQGKTILSQGEAILVQTPDGKTALIDGGLDATSLAAALDTRLPFWQRSLDLVVLTSPRQDALVGLEDVVSRYTIGEALDPGMLHPNTGYARWRHLLDARAIPYFQVRQGASIKLGAWVTFQVLWPGSPLHKGSAEELDNGLAVRVLAPGLRLLLLGETALSKYALNGLLANSQQGMLAADIVQIVGEAGKDFPSALQSVLQAAHPSTVIVTPAALSAKLRKAGASTNLTPLQLQSITGPWQPIETASAGTVEVTSSAAGWSMQTDGADHATPVLCSSYTL